MYAGGWRVVWIILFPRDVFLTFLNHDSRALQYKMKKKEAYTPEQIIQACLIVVNKHGRLFIDEIILELKRKEK